MMIRALASAVTVLSCTFALAVPVAGQGTWTTTLKPVDINHDGIVDAYFDTALNISWLADAHASGLRTWHGASDWAASLSEYGVTGWRLPTGANNCAAVNYGTSGDCRFQPPKTQAAELAFMYYVTLGNKGAPFWPYGLTNSAGFLNPQPGDVFWTNTTGISNVGAPLASYFSTADGESDWSRIDGPGAYAWAVHYGDVSPVPELPSLAYTLFGLAVTGLATAKLNSFAQRRS